MALPSFLKPLVAKIQRLVAEPERLERWRIRMKEHESDAIEREPVEVGAQKSESRVYLNDKPSIAPVNPPLTEKYLTLGAINDAFIDDQGDGNEVRICDDDTFPDSSTAGTEYAVRKCRVGELTKDDAAILESYLEDIIPELDKTVGPAKPVDDVPQPVAESATGSVRLFSRHEGPIVNGEEQNSLTHAQYDVLLALLKAGDKGLTKDALDRKSGHGDARAILKRLAEKDPDWESVISFPGTPGKGYHIQ